MIKRRNSSSGSPLIILHSKPTGHVGHLSCALLVLFHSQKTEMLTQGISTVDQHSFEINLKS